MILWTIQTQKAWDVLDQEGYLVTSKKNIGDVCFEKAYLWMIDQMTDRIGPPPRRNRFPIWAWYQYQSAIKPRPDLRNRAHLPPKTRGVLIEFECDENDVLLSDFELWHYVLNNWFLSESLEEDGISEFEKSAPRDLTKEQVHNQEALEKSWQRIFDLDWSVPDIADPRHLKSIQATIWIIRKEQIRSSKMFIAR